MNLVCQDDFGHRIGPNICLTHWDASFILARIKASPQEWSYCDDHGFVIYREKNSIRSLVIEKGDKKWILRWTGQSG
jgi:hypothetical protein